MATTSKPSAGVAMVLLALMVTATVMVAPAKASTLTVFTGPGCSGMSKDINGCGCFNISGYQAGFQFVYTEQQEGRLYPQANCSRRDSPTILSENTRSCERSIFQGVRLIC